MTTALQSALSPASTPDPVELRCLRDVTITAVALEHRHAAIEKLAKKAIDEGYPREARIFSADAQAIEEDILPRFRDQQELRLVTAAELRGGIAEALRDLVHSTLVRHRADVAGQEDFGRENRLLADIALRVEEFAKSLASRCWSAGFAARKDDPDIHVMRSLDKLRPRES